ncbi:precorrin-3B synthase [Ancylobacter sp. A5.8]|uniref:precorrin-3B synthase n=1 Tax=Ancylobacter gelatini TaxID=2919920 RepID=UPI001F4DEEA2|nr:precorrin-3B synthase [Ancylobacter gelatini]MCJ8141963.1 precorrin-3B synthase [Ancylobacter gelatini]
MTASLRRGACPSLPAPMLTGDGLLARLVPAEPLSPAQLAGLARLARTLGNGVVEVTARGKLQLRGLTSDTAPRLPGGIAALGIAVRPGLAVEFPALAGQAADAVFDPRPLARAIESGAAPFAPELAPKVSVVVDSGGALNLSALSADLALTVGDEPGGVRLVLAGQPIGTIPETEAADMAVALLARLAMRGPAARMAELLRGELQIEPQERAPAHSAEPVGLHPLREGGVALGIALAFGHGEADALEQLAARAEAAGVTSVEPAAGRALLLSALSADAVARLREEAHALGFITNPADPRRAVFACAGRPACGAATLETRPLALALAPLIRGRTLHVSGCSKGCAHPAPTAFAIVGLDEGAGIVVEGSARATPARIVPVAELRARMEAMLAEKAGT